MKKLLSSIMIIGLLTYVLISTEDRLTRIVVVPFLTFGLAYFLQNVFRLLGKQKMAAVMGKVYVIAFAVYWFGFLIVWDYLSIVRKIICPFWFLCCSGSAVVGSSIEG